MGPSMQDNHSSGGSIDLSQFYEIFFEEAGENLDQMEQMLLDLDLETADDEELNAVFRCAHSIKGGAATFGFADVAELTHQMESLLDKLRRHELPHLSHGRCVAGVLRCIAWPAARHQGQMQRRLKPVVWWSESGAGLWPGTDSAASFELRRPRHRHLLHHLWLRISAKARAGNANSKSTSGAGSPRAGGCNR